LCIIVKASGYRRYNSASNAKGFLTQWSPLLRTLKNCKTLMGLWLIFLLIMPIFAIVYYRKFKRLWGTIERAMPSDAGHMESISTNFKAFIVW
jgi:predicted PurR-regulated permease PerM